MGQKCIPKKFLCRFELKLGANAYGILMIILMVACIIAAVVDMVSFKSSEDANTVKRNAYAFTILVIIYSALMIAVHAWFLWAVKKSKASVVLVWVAMNGLWLIQTTIMVIVLLCLYVSDSSFAAWVFSVVFAIIAFIICLYGVLIGYGLWLEIKSQQREGAAQN